MSREDGMRIETKEVKSSQRGEIQAVWDKGRNGFFLLFSLEIGRV